MIPLRLRTIALPLLSMVAIVRSLSAVEPTVDLSGYRAESGVSVEHKDGQLRVTWLLEPVAHHAVHGQIVLDLEPDQPLIRMMGIEHVAPMLPVLESLEPVTYLLVGTRASSGRPALGDERFQRLLRFARQSAVSNLPVEARPEACPRDQSRPSHHVWQSVRSRSDHSRASCNSRSTHSHRCCTSKPSSIRRRIDARSSTTPAWYSRSPGKGSASPGWTPKDISRARNRPRTPWIVRSPSGTAH